MLNKQRIKLKQHAEILYVKISKFSHNHIIGWNHERFNESISCQYYGATLTATIHVSLIFSEQFLSHKYKYNYDTTLLDYFPLFWCYHPYLNILIKNKEKTTVYPSTAASILYRNQTPTHTEFNYIQYQSLKQLYFQV